MDKDLVVSSHQVDFGENETTEKLVGVIMNILDGVAVGNGTGFEGSVIATGTPPIALLGYDVERRKPGTLGVASCAVPQHGVESALAMLSRSRAKRPAVGDRLACYSPDVLDGVMADFALDSGWVSEVRECGEEDVDRCAAIDCLDTGEQRVGSLGRYGQRRD
jgi:hypothetical protein